MEFSITFTQLVPQFWLKLAAWILSISNRLRQSLTSWRRLELSVVPTAPGLLLSNLVPKPEGSCQPCGNYPASIVPLLLTATLSPTSRIFLPLSMALPFFQYFFVLALFIPSSFLYFFFSPSLPFFLSIFFLSFLNISLFSCIHFSATAL